MTGSSWVRLRGLGRETKETTSRGCWVNQAGCLAPRSSGRCFTILSLGCNEACSREELRRPMTQLMAFHRWTLELN